MLDIETISAAQDNDLEAIAAVVTGVEPILAGIAGRAAQRMSPHGGHHKEELLQAARVAVWEALPRFTVTTVADFESFVGRTAYTALLDAARAERNPGADKDAVKVFASMLEAADGDPYLAEKLAQTEPPAGRRLGPDRARAARMAWQGAVSIDAQSNGGSVADTLAVIDEVAEIRPKVGHGAALEALSVLRRYANVTVPRMTPREFAANLPALVDALEDAVTVPRDAAARRYVLDALRILRSAVSTASDSEIAPDLVDASDERMADFRRVHYVLSLLSPGQREVCNHAFGFNGADPLGWDDNAALAEALGTTTDRLKVQKNKAKARFAALWVLAGGK